jgi:hypothetical protein
VFGGDTAPLVYFLSFAFAASDGAQHELTKAALLPVRHCRIGGSGRREDQADVRDG